MRKKRIPNGRTKLKMRTIKREIPWSSHIYPLETEAHDGRNDYWLEWNLQIHCKVRVCGIIMACCVTLCDAFSTKFCVPARPKLP
jgi:hypothetical protein